MERKETTCIMTSNGEDYNVIIVFILLINIHVYNAECRATRAPDKSNGRIRCPGGVNILY
jgi:hypothetical protein